MASGRLPVYSDTNCAEGLRLYNTGMTWQVAGERVGVPWQVLRDRARVRGWKVNGRKRRPRAQRLVLPTAETDLAYLAAMIDGEGHISRRDGERGRLPHYSVGISNTSVALIEWLATFGGGISRSTNCLRWQVSSTRDVLALLQATLPYMRIKQAKARRAIRELERRVEPDDARLALEAYASVYLGEELSRDETMARLDELLALERLTPA